MTPDRALELVERWYMAPGSCGGQTIKALTSSELSALINEEESRKFDWLEHELAHLVSLDRNALFELVRKARAL